MAVIEFNKTENYSIADFHKAFNIPPYEITDSIIIGLIGILNGTEWGVSFYYRHKQLTRYEIVQAVINECIESKEQIYNKVRQLFISEVFKNV